MLHLIGGAAITASRPAPPLPPRAMPRKDFAAEVQGKCEMAARAQVELPHAVVDPFGSENFGMALVTGKPKGANGFVSYFCIYDKKTKAVELGLELETERMGILRGE